MVTDEKKDIGEDFKGILKALELIAKEEGFKGVIKCPLCENDLHWRRAPSNKHIWGKCKTENCLAWVQ